MKQAIKNVLIYAAKNAVNAAILAGIQIYHDPADNNLHSWHGIEGVLWMICSAVGARELMVWGPKILAWSKTNGN